MKKKLFVIFLSLVMVVTMMPLSVFAQDGNTSDASAEENENIYLEGKTYDEDEGKVIHDPSNADLEYLQFEVVNDKLTISNPSLEGKVQYSIDKEDWKELKGSVEVPKETSIYLRSIETQGQDFKAGNFVVAGDGILRAKGNIMSLIDPKCQGDEVPAYGFSQLFQNCRQLETAPNLPAMKLGDGCYAGMFEGCSRLKEAPKLPATDLTSQSLVVGVYEGMFSKCDALVKTPEFPAKELGPGSYRNMFSDCENLQETSELPAEKLDIESYKEMFCRCKNLIKVGDIDATTYGIRSCEGMFADCTSIQKAPNMKAETLENECCQRMFYGCTSLTEVPELPALTLKDYCYKKMFERCSSLKDAPELPATELAYQCYVSMFDSCSSLVNPPELPATTLVEDCYRQMFADCIKLENAPALQADQVPEMAYASMFYHCTSLKVAPELPAELLDATCYYGMFENCENLVKAPELPAEYLPGYGSFLIGCYEQMFMGCKNLVQAPTLVAKKLGSGCYRNMFNGCEKLANIKCNFEYWNDEYGSTDNWLTGVSAKGTFECRQDLKIPSRDENHIPAGWVINGDIPQVTGLNAKASDSKTCSLSWNKVPSLNGVQYQIYRSTDATNGFSKIATTSSNTYKDTKVIPGNKYYYKVRATVTTDKTYSGDFSNTDYGYPRIFQVTGFSAKAINAGQAQLTWKANGNKNVYYEVYRSTKANGGFKKTATIKNGKTTYTQNFTPTQSGTKYYYKVRAVVKDYKGKWHYTKFSNVDYAYPRVNTPTNFKAWASDKHTAHCTWNKVSGKNIKYFIYRGTKPTGDWGNTIKITTSNKFTQSHMKSGQKYYYMVRAMQTVNGKNYFSEYSNKDYAYPR